MDYKTKKQIIEEMGKLVNIKNEEKECRAEYIASSNALKINQSLKINVDSESQSKELTLVERLEKVAKEYRKRGK